MLIKRDSSQVLAETAASEELYLPLDEGGEIMHMAAARHDGQYVAQRGGRRSSAEKRMDLWEVWLTGV